MKTTRAARRLWPLVAAFVAAGCTFTGLADYDTPSCDPTLPYAQDPCATIDVGNTSCVRAQCDPATNRCSTRPLDEDKDGDPSIACGGTDCDDHDPRRSGHATEICDGIDNDCNGITDDDLLVASDDATEKVLAAARVDGGADLALRAENALAGHATYLGVEDNCVRDVTLGSAPATDAGCTRVVVADASAPSVRQPQLRTVGSATNSTIGIAFVSATIEAPCTHERLGYFGGNVDGNGGGVLGDCGATLPTLASFPNSTEALIAFYDAPLAERQDPIDGCASAAPAPLRVRYVDGALGGAPDLFTSVAADLGDATSTRPPVLVPIADRTTLLLASPFGASVGVWALTPDGRVVPLVTSIDALVGARSVAMNLRAGAMSIALVAEQGCTPSQSLTLVIADFDATGPSIGAFTKTVIVAGPATVATAPSLAWSAARNEWWVSWIDASDKAMLVRVSADGARVSPALEVGDASAVVLAADAALAVDTGADPLVFLSRPDRPAVDQRVLSCRK